MKCGWTLSTERSLLNLVTLSHNKPLSRTKALILGTFQGPQISLRNFSSTIPFPILPFTTLFEPDFGSVLVPHDAQFFQVDSRNGNVVFTRTIRIKSFLCIIHLFLGYGPFWRLACFRILQHVFHDNLVQPTRWNFQQVLISPSYLRLINQALVFANQFFLRFICLSGHAILILFFYFFISVSWYKIFIASSACQSLEISRTATLHC